jgi:hypothetical protein
MVNRKSAGAELVTRIRAELAANGLEPDGRETELLAQAQALADRIEAMEMALAEDGLRITLESGRVVPHPFIAESRQHRGALARLLAGVQMEAGTKNATKQKAANTRWAKKAAS